jgi:hypothetical protein
MCGPSYLKTEDGLREISTAHNRKRQEQHRQMVKFLNKDGIKARIVTKTKYGKIRHVLVADIPMRTNRWNWYDEKAKKYGLLTMHALLQKESW